MCKALFNNIYYTTAFEKLWFAINIFVVDGKTGLDRKFAAHFVHICKKN